LLSVVVEALILVLRYIVLCYLQLKKRPLQLK